jgi:hypothetical protein
MKKLHDVLQQLKETGHYLIDTENKQVLTREQIGEMISNDYIEAVECLEDNSFMETFQVADQPMADLLQTLESKYEKPEQILFYLQYELSPNLPFSYREIVYRDVQSMGNAILTDKAEKETILEAMKLKMFSFYARYKELDAAKEKIVEQIDFAENYIIKHQDIAYYLLGYILADRNYYKYGRRKFKSLVVFYSYLVEKKKLLSFSKRIDDDLLFMAWLYYLGHAEIIEKWKEEVNRVTELEFSVLHKYDDVGALKPDPLKLEKDRAKAQKLKEKEARKQQEAEEEKAVQRVTVERVKEKKKKK